MSQTPPAPLAPRDASAAPIPVIEPEWPAPAGARACTSTRRGGSSAPPFDDLNLAGHVGDDPAAVAANRARLRRALALPAEPVWLRQVHGAAVIALAAGTGSVPPADGAVTSFPGRVCAVLSADCVPIVLCARDATRIGVLHGGWRGLAAGIIAAGVAAMGRAPQDLLAWLGPAIGAGAYEVDEPVRAALLDPAPALEPAFTPARAGRWHADLGAIARLQLGACGVRAVYASGRCTVSEPAAFFSHRRDGTTGRMATLAWLEPRAPGHAA